MTHYDDDQLQAHLASPDPAVGRHAESCRECRDTLDFLRRFDETLRDPETWAVAEELESGPFTPPPALRERAASIDAERKRVAELLAPVLVSLVAFQEADIEHDRKFHGEEVVRQLCDEAYALRQREPKFALRLVESALAIAGKGRAAGQLLGTAHLEHGAVLFVSGRYREAERALAKAETIFAEAGAQWELAHVWLVRANVCVETDRLADALQLASAAAGIYREFGDREREHSSLMICGRIHAERRDWPRAIAIYEQILASAEADADVLTTARATHNLGNCYERLGEFYRATEYYSRAAAIWDELGMDAEVVRVDWSIATIMISWGQIERGLAQLVLVRNRFALLGIVNDEALVRLQIAEALLGLERPAEVPSLLEDIVVQFASEGMMRNAKQALAYLTEALKTGRLTVRQVQHVRVYLEDLPLRPAATFEPLQ